MPTYSPDNITIPHPTKAPTVFIEKNEMTNRQSQLTGNDQRGGLEPVLNFSSKNNKKIETTPSAPINAIRVMSYGPTYFKVTRGTGNKQLDIPVMIKNQETLQVYDTMALCDTGCTGSCINRNFVQCAGLSPKPFPHPIDVFNADGSPNIGGRITHYVDVQL